jgi:hypothetical protein
MTFTQLFRLLRRVLFGLTKEERITWLPLPEQQNGLEAWRDVESATDWVEEHRGNKKPYSHPSQEHSLNVTNTKDNHGNIH